ncbi:MAG TPA: tetratricopeptide repeat protein, partial [Spirochaetota bacterium]
MKKNNFIFRNKSLLRIIVLLLVVTFFSCNAKGWDQGYAGYGFYFSSEDAIAALSAKGRNLSPIEHYILANAYKNQNNPKKAAVHFANCAFMYSRNLSLKPYPSPIYDYLNGWHIKSDYYSDAAYELGLIFYNYAEYEYAAKFAAMVPPTDLSLYREAIILQSKSLEQLKHYNEAITLLRKSLMHFPHKELTPVLHIRIASAYLKKKDYPHALDEFSQSLAIAPEGWQGATAGKESYAIIKAGKVSIPAKSSLLIAEGLVAAKEYDKALEVLELSQTSATAESDNVRVSAYAGQGKIAQADKIIAAYNPMSSDRFHLLTTKADILWNNGRHAEAVATIKELIRIPQQDNRKQFRRLCFSLYENNSSDAPAYLALYEKTFPADQQSGKMLWYAAKIFVEQKDFSTARDFLNRIIDNHSESEYSGNARFWIYKILLSERRTDDAEKVFRSMPAYSPGSAYTWILMNRKKNDYTENSLSAMFDKGISSHDVVTSLFAHSMLYLKNGDNEERKSRMKEISTSGMNPWATFNSEISKLHLSSEYKDILPAIEKYYAAGDNDNIQRI